MKHESINADFIKTLPSRMDFSCVRTMHDHGELQNLVDFSKKYRPACAFSLPAMTDYLVDQLQRIPAVKVGGVISFPSGGDTIEQKVFQTRDLLAKGCGELDMVMNLTFLKTEQYQLCLKDMQSVVEAAERTPVKVIIEASLLTEEEICRASELVVKAGASFVKTGTGWVGPTTVRQVELIYKTIGDSAYIKAAGGIRTFEFIKELYRAGCDRFGVGATPAAAILAEAEMLNENE